ncbi:drug/metabolite transporter (DMT)-like permease [Azospirillum agricola]|uniref:DMT family transporter n=1 Tax=Azospirillum agricola TaxID=1720247 RepID=UPI001AE39E58|nr:DMT family transporter [Azospirillum agricola]MBP2231406.1 drug/metabolite transporter (DMT)-like permease [Azospirillum agricola]
MTDEAVKGGRSAVSRQEAVRAGPNPTVYAQLAGIVLFWGANWPLMKLALVDIGPLAFCAVRLVGTALSVAALAPVLRFPLLPRRGERLMIAVIGLLQVGGMMGLSNIGLQFVSPGRASVLAYTMQMWALPLGLLLLGERITRRRAAAALLTFAGVVVFFNPALVNWSDPNALIGNGLLIGCAVSWALGATLYRRRVWRTPFWTQTFWQIAASAVVMVPLALLTESGHPVHWSGSLLAVIAYNCLIATGLCYWWWGKALSVMPASQAGQIVCLVPVTALLLSAAFYNEPLNLGVLLSVALIGGGIVLSARVR